MHVLTRKKTNYGEEKTKEEYRYLSDATTKAKTFEALMKH